MQVELPTARKSVGAEVNYGIRFSTDADATAFLHELSKEVAKRLSLCGARGRTVTLKLKRRKANAPVDPPKFLGHGLCDNFSKSMSLGSAVASAEAVFAAARELFAALAVPPAEVRGVGISVARLDGQPQRAAGVSLPADMHVASLRALWAKGATAGCDDGVAVGGGDCHADEQAGLTDEDAQDEHWEDGSDHADEGASAGPVLNGIRTGAHVGDPELVDAHALEAADPAGERDCHGMSGGAGEGLQGSEHAPVAPGVHEAAVEDQPPGAVGGMQAIPDFHSLDMSVVDSLPAPMRLELMRAYGLHSKALPPQLRGGRQNGGGTAAARGQARATPHKLAPPRPAAAARRAVATEALPPAPRKRVRVAMHGLTMSQVDEGVLAELPADVQAGVREGLPESRGTFRQVQAADKLATRGGPGLIHAVQVRSDCVCQLDDAPSCDAPAHVHTARAAVCWRGVVCVGHSPVFPWLADACRHLEGLMKGQLSSKGALRVTSQISSSWVGCCGRVHGASASTCKYRMCLVCVHGCRCYYRRNCGALGALAQCVLRK